MKKRILITACSLEIGGIERSLVGLLDVFDYDQYDVDVLLFKTPTCPNCKAAMALLDRAGIVYQALNANEEKELAQRYEVKQAPTLVLANGASYEKFRGVSDIKGWLMHRQ